MLFFFRIIVYTIYFIVPGVPCKALKKVFKTLLFSLLGF